MRIIPAIDIIDGKCVRLTKGDYDQKKVYNEDPLAVARQFEDAGLKYLHLVDLDGAKAGKVVNCHIVELLTSNTKLIIDFGGGVKTDDEIKRLFDLGVKQVNLGSIAVKDRDNVLKWKDQFGADKIIISADVKNELIAIHGWQSNSDLNILEFLRFYIDHRILNVTCTDIDTDGTLLGPNVSLYKKIISEFPEVKLVASGGVGSVKDVINLKTTGVDGVIIGKAFYEGRITVEELASV